MTQAPDEPRTGRLYALLIIVLVILGGGGLTLYSMSRWWLPPVASVHGLAVDRLFNITLAVTGLVYLGVHVLLAWLIWRFAARGTEGAAHWHEHRTLELTYTIVPAIVLVILISMGAVVFARVHSAPPSNA
ncbi:MAG: cytochrome c oxidase subunit II transmembrane domain-containing protein, partial [bacterium]